MKVARSIVELFLSIGGVTLFTFIFFIEKKDIIIVFFLPLSFTTVSQVAFDKAIAELNDLNSSIRAIMSAAPFSITIR